MITVEKLTASMFPEIHRTFLADDTPTVSRAQWEPLFTYPWAAQDHRGFVLADGSRIVGVLGMIFSERQIDGSSRRFCNLHNWWVDEAYRGKSLLLMRHALKLEDTTLTDLTPTPPVIEISKRLGFQELDTTARLLLPTRRDPTQDGLDGFEITDSEEVIEEVLDESDRAIFRDHKAFELRHTVVRSDREYCYLVHARVTKHWLPYCHVHYFSNAKLFERLQAPLRAYLLRSTGARFVALDARRISGMKLPVGFDVRMRCLYRSPQVKPEQIDNLYSEVALLNLTTLPGLRNLGKRLRTASRAFLSAAPRFTGARAAKANGVHGPK